MSIYLSEIEIIEHFGLDNVKDRISSKFSSQLKELFDIDFDLTNVTEVISHLEGNSTRQNVKKPTKFSRGKLKGFYHSHFLDFPASGMPANFLKFFEKPGYIENLLKKADAESIGMDAQQKSHYFASKLVSILQSELDSNRSHTGNWLIYGVHEGYKYYLMMCPHPKKGEDTDPIYEILKSECEKQFPFLFVNAA